MKLRFAPHLSAGLHIGNLYSLNLIQDLSRHLQASLTWRLDGFDTSNLSNSITIFRQQLATLDSLSFNFSKFYLCPNKVDSSFFSGPFKDYIYDCYEEEKDLQGWRSKVGSKVPFTKSDRFKRVKDSKLKAYWRLDLRKAYLQVKNVCCERGSINFFQGNFLESTSDPVLVRSDGSLTYLLSSVLSDYQEGINLIVRGNDLIPGAKVQALMFSILEFPVTFYHHGLFLDDQGKLSKRSKSHDLTYLSKQGYPLTAFNAWICRQFKNQNRPLVELVSSKNKVISWTLMKEELNKLFLRLPYHVVKGNLPSKITINQWYHLRTIVKNLSELRNLDLSEKGSLITSVNNLTDEEVKTFLRLLSRLFLNTSEGKTPSISWLVRWRSPSYLKSLVELLELRLIKNFYRDRVK